MSLQTFYKIGWAICIFNAINSLLLFASLSNTGNLIDLFLGLATGLLSLQIFYQLRSAENARKEDSE
jgi:hypothetical protein